MSNLIRLRADPSKVRVSVRPCRGVWRARVESRLDPDRDNCETFHSDPREAVTIALDVAKDYIDGIDLGLQ